MLLCRATGMQQTNCWQFWRRVLSFRRAGRKLQFFPGQFRLKLRVTRNQLNKKIRLIRSTILNVLVRKYLACENIRFSSLFVAGDVSRGGTSATQEQKFHTDDANQCLHNKSGSHGVPNLNLSNFACLLVDFG